MSRQQRIFRRVFSWLPVVAVALLGAVAMPGCGAPGVDVYFAEPAPYSLGRSSRLVIVQVEGRRGIRDEFREEMNRELAAQARNAGYWQAEDRTGLGIALQTDSGQANASMLPGGGEVFLRFDVHVFEASPVSWTETERVRTGTDANGHAIYSDRAVTRMGMEARLEFSVWTLHGDNQATMRGKEYNHRTRLHTPDAFAAKQRVLREAVSEFLDEITPRMRRTRVRLDDQAEDMKEIVQMASQRQYAEAAQQLEAMQAAGSGRADVLYNLAVMYDAMGRYDEALELYSQAINMGGKDYYVSTRADCSSRAQAAAALQQ